MKASIATVCISGSLSDKLSAIARAGFDGYELFENDFVTSELSASDVRKRGADLGLKLDLYQPFRDIEGTDEATFLRALERAKRKFALMGELGADLMLVCSNVASASIDDDALASAQLNALAEVAQNHGIRLAYEPLAWGTYVSTYDHGWRIVEAADHPALGMCLDSFHILSRRTELSGIAEIAPDKIFFCQLADAPTMDLDVLSWSRHHRLFPGEGDWDLADFVARVIGVGYDGPLSLEVFNDVFRQGDPTVTARDARRSLRVLEDATLQQGGLGIATAKLKSRLDPLPPVVVPSEFDFIEIQPGEGEAVGELFRVLGFSRSGRHRRKDVELWEQGDIRIIVNQENPGRTARITGVGLAVDDPATAAERIQALRLPRVPRDQQSGEGSLDLVLAPDGTEFSFGALGSPWRAEFPKPAPAVPADLGLRRIDHVALVQPWRRIHEAVLLLRSALGLEREPGHELISAAGLVQSRALASADRRVRIALNVTPAHDDAQEWLVNHVAFTVDDLIGVAARLRDVGLELLSIPDNYYEDLQARFDFDDVFIDRLRSARVLYDRSVDGEFLHAYTPILGGFYVELVERSGGYDGYGAANASVRLAAHRNQRSRVSAHRPVNGAS